MKTLFLFALLVAIPCTTFAQQSCPVPSDRSASEIPLCLVARQITSTLDTYNASAAAKDLPPLSKVIFDFKTSVATTGGFSFKIFLFSLGASHEKDATNDVSFTYTVPTPRFNPSIAPHDFSATLLATLQAAAGQVKQTPTVGKGKFSSLTVSMAYGVSWDASAGASAPISLVTIGGSVDRKRSDIQSLTLIFGQ